MLELYCTDRGCDCRRVLLQIVSVERHEVVATINYGFEASAQQPTGSSNAWLLLSRRRSRARTDRRVLHRRLLGLQQPPPQLVVDFINDPVEVLAAFKAYHTTAELSATTDPNLVFDLKAKLDSAGHYDDFEVDRVVEVVLDPKAKQGDLVAALTPVEDRVMKRYKAARLALEAAKQTGDATAADGAKAEMEALVLFQRDMGAFVRLYTFLSQIFDYGNTAIEKRAIFYKKLIPLLEFGREREGIDLSKVKLTHHTLKSRGTAAMSLAAGEKPLLYPVVEAGSGTVQDKEKAYLSAIIEKLNTLFDGDLTDDDQLVYVNHVIMGKLLESAMLVQQAANNTKEQFSNSPDLKTELRNALMEALDAHTSMSSQALNSETIQAGILDILLNHARLWESLRDRAPGAMP